MTIIQTNLEIVDTIFLKTLKSTKITKDGFDLTYMLPIGTDYTTETKTISNVNLQEYTFSNTAQRGLDNNLHILQHNNTVCNTDYTIDSWCLSDITLSNSISLAVGDTLTLRIYEDSEPQASRLLN